MARQATLKHVRKAGAFSNGELAAGEWGLDVTAGEWWFSRNGTTVEQPPSGGASDINDLGDVTISAPADKEVLAFDNGSGDWINQTLAEAGIAPVASPALTGTPTMPTASAGTNTTQGASTAFVIAEILARLAVGDFQSYKGAIDASANPNYPAGNAGDVYRISVAGKIGGASGPNVEVGDTIMLHVDGSAGGNHATVGTDWDIIQGNIDVTSFIRTLLDDADAAAARTTLGAAATSHSHAGADITSGDIATARMQTNVVAAINAAAGTQTAGTIDCGTL